MMLFTEFGKIKHLALDSKEAQNAVENLHQYITDHYYICTTQILQVIGQMYVADERFKNNIDTFSGVGTAEFVSNAIGMYCDKWC